MGEHSPLGPHPQGKGERRVTQPVATSQLREISTGVLAFVVNGVVIAKSASKEDGIFLTRVAQFVGEHHVVLKVALNTSPTKEMENAKRQSELRIQRKLREGDRWFRARETS